MSKQELDNFNELFKTKDHVFIGFRSGWSHGYISKADEQGIYVVQLKHAKEYFYPWEHFEVITHDGCFVKKTNPAEVARMVEIVPKGGLTDLNSRKLLSEFKNNNFNFPITDQRAIDILSKESIFNRLCKTYYSFLYRYASQITDIDMSLEPNLISGAFVNVPLPSKFLRHLQIEEDDNIAYLVIRGRHYTVKWPIVNLPKSAYKPANDKLLLNKGLYKYEGTNKYAYVPNSKSVQIEPFLYDTDKVYDELDITEKTLNRIIFGRKGALKQCSRVYCGDPWMIETKDIDMVFINSRAQLYLPVDES